MILSELSDKIKYKFQIGDKIVVILKQSRDVGPDANLLIFDGNTNQLLFRHEPPVKFADQYDGFINGWMKDDNLWIGSWSGFEFQVDSITGALIHGKFTK